MKWNIISAATALAVAVFTSLVACYPEYYKLWGVVGLFGVVFATMLLRNPAFRYMRLAWWITAAWVTSAAVPNISATFQVRDDVSGAFSFGNQLGWAFHVAFAAGRTHQKTPKMLKWAI